MKKAIFMVLFLMLSTFALAIDVDPYETRTLPQITSSKALDTDGLLRTYLYCSWRIDGQGQEAVQMTGEVCPETAVTYEFQGDETYYARIDYADIGYGEVSHQWELITTGTAGELTQEYNLDIPEPPQSMFDLMYSVIRGTVRNIICQLFPFLGIC